MITLFRKTREGLVPGNRFGKYLLYALGEIILVVIGILIALQINNYNDERKERRKEVGYLRNIKRDLIANNGEIQKYINERTQCVEHANTILAHFNGVPVTDWDKFNDQTIAIYNWRKFYQSNNTFTELTNSGNFEVLSNDTIKTMLLDLESLYKKNKSGGGSFQI